MLNVWSLQAQADDAVIRAEVASTNARAARERLADRTRRFERARGRAADDAGIASARAQRDEGSHDEGSVA